MFPAMNESPAPTEIALKKGDHVLFHGRIATVETTSNWPGKARTVEVVDGGGRARSFFVLFGAPIVYFPTVLDALATVGDVETDDLDDAELRAELYFANPRIGDVFIHCDRHYFMKVVDRPEGEVHVVTADAGLAYERFKVKWGTVPQRFSSVSHFQATYERQDAPGYQLLAWGFNKHRDADRNKSLGPIGGPK
jgi:hypothetical protein